MGRDTLALGKTDLKLNKRQNTSGVSKTIKMGCLDCLSELDPGHAGLAVLSILIALLLTTSCFKSGFPSLGCAASVRGPYPPTLRPSGAQFCIKNQNQQETWELH